MNILYIDENNKLAIETDNGSIDSEGKMSVAIKTDETFIIKGENVVRIISALSNKEFARSFYGNKFIIISKDKAFADLEKEYDEQIKKLSEKYHVLRKAITDFNANKRFRWRPIEIKD